MLVSLVMTRQEIRPETWGSNYETAEMRERMGIPVTRLERKISSVGLVLMVGIFIGMLIFLK
jgi:hypothetical protein